MFLCRYYGLEEIALAKAKVTSSKSFRSCTLATLLRENEEQGIFQEYEM
jgi:hypothetical protein